MSHAPRSHRDPRERNGEQRRDRMPRDERRWSPDRSSSRPPYEASVAESHRRQRSAREAPRLEPQHDSKCANICSRRGIVLICSVLTNALVLVCLVAAHLAASGLSSAAGLGGFSLNANINFQGTELQQVRELDMQYSQLRAPGLYGGLPFSLTLGALSLLLAVSGGRPLRRTSPGLLRGALLFQAVAAVAYVAAVGLYLHFVMRVNATEVCARRHALYARNGYTWMSCEVGGGDAAVALFGLITALLYAAGAALTFRATRALARYRREAAGGRGPQRAALRAETTAV